MLTADELIRKALQDRADTVTTNTLRYPEMRQDSPTRRPHQPGAGGRTRALLATAATVVAVVAIAVGAYGLRSGGGNSNPASGTPKALVGTHWRLTEIRSAGDTSRVPPTYTAELAFGAGGQLNGRDGINALAGSYRTSGSRITLHVTEVGAAGGTGTIPAQEAMSGIYVPTSPQADSVTSTFSLTATTLTVTSSRWTLTFHIVPASSTSTPTSTPTPTLSAPDSYCLHTPPPRTGTDTSLVPATPTALTIYPNGPTRPAKTITDISALVQALDALPTNPAANGCQARGASALPAVGTYELHFHYLSGPDVLVNVLPQCRPSINNRRLQADSSTTVIPLIQAALEQS